MKTIWIVSLLLEGVFALAYKPEPNSAAMNLLGFAFIVSLVGISIAAARESKTGSFNRYGEAKDSNNLESIRRFQELDFQRRGTPFDDRNHTH
jgi:hypothetical protein